MNDPPREPQAPSQPVRWDIYPAFPNSIRLGEVEADHEREAVEKAAKKLGQDPAILIVGAASVTRTLSLRVGHLNLKRCRTRFEEAE